LPLVDIPIELPPRWAKETATAIQSGIIYTVLAGIKDYIVAWREEFPEGQIVLTGGDRILLLTHFTKLFPELGASMIVAPEVIFWGIAKIWHQIY
ncbi:MAG: pantothenate kinase, partial [Okeania sp. SIO4D6]|nr:pantothenate kinase [Okeania sp. SIO4D6]